jgi:DNA-binding Lrp family transcriptional regulator
MDIDDIDTKLLDQIQRNARLSTSELASQVELSPAGVHRRLKKLYDQGIIRQTVALVDRHKVGLDLLCILRATFRDNMDPRNREALARATAALPEVLECYTLTGDSDVLMKVAVRDHQALKSFLERFAKAQNVIARVETAIVLEEIKSTTALNVTRKQQTRDAP